MLVCLTILPKTLFKVFIIGDFFIFIFTYFLFVRLFETRFLPFLQNVKEPYLFTTFSRSFL